MVENTKIEWATHTWNPWIGCTKVSPACDHCYAEELMSKRYGRVEWGAGEDRSRTSAATWKMPLKWDRAAAAAGRIDTVFCLSLGDIWDKEVDPLWRRQSFEVMEATPNLVYLLLSKRIGNAVKMAGGPLQGTPMLPPNCALGATVTNQEEVERDVPKLLEARDRLAPRFTFLSIEPMLGPIDLWAGDPDPRLGGLRARHSFIGHHWPAGASRQHPGYHGVDWVIVGGESGHGARPMHPDWVRSLRDQCHVAEVPFLFKQWGAWAPDGVNFVSHTVERVGTIDPLLGKGNAVAWRWRHEPKDGQSHGDQLHRVDKKAAGRLLDGIEHNGMPEVANG